MARSHIKLWWGDLVISNRASRHPEERNGEVLHSLSATHALHGGRTHNWQTRGATQEVE
jgi:hypothetical protein